MSRKSELSSEQLAQIAVESYVYLYPLVLMELTRQQMTSGPAGVAFGQGPASVFHHARVLPPSNFRTIVRPNFDTLYSVAWVDVSVEPHIVSAPDSGDRYYMLPCYDMWTDAFAVPGSRTSGNDAVSFALATPAWSGVLPEGVERIDAPTPVVWIVGRTQANGPADYPAVNAFQDGLTITPLSSWGRELPAPVVVDDSHVDRTPPLEQIRAMSGADFFSLAAGLLAVHPPHQSDWSTVARLRRLGLDLAGKPFEPLTQSASVQAAIASAPSTATIAMASLVPRLAPPVDGWVTMTDTIGVYGNFYLKRAAIAMIGLGANPEADAVYPLLMTDSDGNPLDGAHDYVLHFDADRLPPADAFWSVTMYDNDGFTVPNEIDRCALGDRDNLTYNPDGSLDLYIQHENPGPDKVSNWLPAPRGTLGITMRLYEPRPNVFSREWTAPPVRRT